MVVVLPLPDDVRFNTKDTVFRNEKQARIWIYRNQLEKRNLNDANRIKVAMALSEELEGEARENQEVTQFQKKSTASCERNSPQKLFETNEEKQKRWNKNRVNAQLADLAGVSTDKVFRYKEILEHGTPEEIAEVESGEVKIRPTYDKMLARSRKETSAVSFPQEKYRVVYSDFYERDDSILGWTPKRKTLGKIGLEQLFGAPRGAYSLAVERTVTKVQTQYIVYRVLNLWR